MSFQKTVRKDMAFGVVGELQFSGPLRAGAYVLKSDSEANNIIGRAFTFVEDEPGYVQAGGDGEFAGILANAKVYARRGAVVSAANTDEELLQVPNGVAAEFVTMALLTVNIASAAKIGDTVQYDNTTGELSVSATKGTADSGKTLVPNCVVARYAQTDPDGGLVLIRLTN